MGLNRFSCLLMIVSIYLLSKIFKIHEFMTNYYLNTSNTLSMSNYR